MNTNSSFPFRAVGAGAVISAAGWMAGDLPIDNAATISWLLTLSSTLGLIALPVGMYIRRQNSTFGILARARRRTQKSGGTLTWREHRRVASKAAMRRKAKVLIPRTGDLSRKERRQVPVTEYAFHVATEGRFRKIYSPCEEHTLLLGGPRMGKTALLGCFILDAPGACVVTSTRNDLALATMTLREKKGPVFIFDPAGTSGLASNVKWSILSGCDNGTVARLRATDMIPASTGEGERWDDIARRTLAVLMHAAALRNGSMLDVLRWAARPDNQARLQVEEALERSLGGNVQVWKDHSDQFFKNNDRTKTSITTAIMKPLEWMLDGSAYGSGIAAQDDMFSVDTLIDTAATIYMIGAKSDKVAPLVSALTGEIARQARMRAKAEGGRLQVPLTLVLDEAAIISPVPLPDWSADMGGFNINMHVGCQDPAQLRDVWGDNGASSFMSHIGTTLIFGGIQEIDYLEECSKKSGTRDITVDTKGKDGNITVQTRKENVISPDQVMRLDAHTVMVIRKGLSACIATTPKFWERSDYKKAQKNPYTRKEPRATNYEEQTRREQQQDQTQEGETL